MANSSDSNKEQIRTQETTNDTDAAATAKADEKAIPTKKDNSDADSSQQPMGPDIPKDGSMPRW